MSNLALAIYAIAKVASTREFLQNDPVQIDRVLTRISLTDNQRIRANCNRAFKNLNSDLNEAIEEGAVSNLIAISLEVRIAVCSLSVPFNDHYFSLSVGQAQEPVIRRVHRALHRPAGGEEHPGPRVRRGRCQGRGGRDMVRGGHSHQR